MKRWYRLSMMVLVFLIVWGRGYSQLSAEDKPKHLRFSKAANGIISDSVTGLEWYVGPNTDNNWHEAKTWVENLSIAGGGWRMPTVPELKALYQNGASPYNMDPLFGTPGVWVWSGQLNDASTAWGFAFYNGLEGWHGLDYGYGRQVLAVRTRR